MLGEMSKTVGLPESSAALAARGSIRGVESVSANVQTCVEGCGQRFQVRVVQHRVNALLAPQIHRLSV